MGGELGCWMGLAMRACKAVPTQATLLLLPSGQPWWGLGGTAGARAPDVAQSAGPWWPAEEGQCHDSSGTGGGGAQAGGHLTMRFCPPGAALRAVALRYIEMDFAGGPSCVC